MPPLRVVRVFGFVSSAANARMHKEHRKTKRQ